MLVKGYSFREVYENGLHSKDENALKYDGDKLQLYHNNNGYIHIKVLITMNY